MTIIMRAALILLASSAVGFPAAERTAAPRRAQTARRAVRQLDSIQDFESALESAGDDVMIVDYSTTTCGPCQLIAPKYEHMSTLYEDFHFYQVVGVVGDKSCEAWELFAHQGVELVPTFHFYKNGERQSELSGSKLTSIELIDAIEAIRWGD